MDEETERLNALCAKAHELGLVVELGAGVPPQLNEDGGLGDEELPLADDDE